MNRSDTIYIQVQDLRVGDRLWPTMRTVTSAPYRCARCPAGKSKLALDGRTVMFGTYTKVSAIR